MHLKAIKSTKYLTRRLLPGDVFEVQDNRDGNLMAKILLATRKAVVHREPGKIAPPPKRLLDAFDHDGDGEPGGSKSATPSDDLSTLRAEYQSKLGKRPFNGWDVDTLRVKIAEADG